jgi:hypothetical protein
VRNILVNAKCRNVKLGFYCIYTHLFLSFFLCLREKSCHMALGLTAVMLVAVGHNKLFLHVVLFYCNLFQLIYKEPSSG